MKKIILTLTIVIFIFSSCKKEKPDVTHNYYYEVSGTANSYNITLESSPSGTSQYANVASGWQYKWTQINDNPRFLYISAQNNTSAGTVTVKIIRDGVTLATNSSSGAFVIATADGTF